MKLAIILATAAYATACTNVSVEGDATYCIEGAICGGNGSACPKQGDWASGDCKTGLFSSKNGWCQAPESAVCLTLKTGARGCVYPSKGPQKMVAGMTAEAEQACTNVSVEGDATYCVNGPVCSGNSGSGACPKKGDWASGDCKSGLFSSNGKWCQAPEDATCQKLKTGAWGCVYPSKGPQKMAVEAEQGCTNVSVEGDATYCVNGPVCSGNSGGGACPKQGDWASGDCKTGLFSSKNGWCQAPETATCQKLKTGAWGCVYPSKGPQKMAVEAEQGCTNVSVEGDATYCIEGAICGGNGSACPKKGDWASGDCKTGLFSSKNGWCQAPESAVCLTLKTGARGCVYPSKGPQKMVADMAAEAEQGCTNVSVEGDATYCVNGPVCSGNSSGGACPKKGDWASGDCKTGLYSSQHGWCQAPETATCQKLKTGAWGCVYPSKGPQKMDAHLRSGHELSA